MSVLVLLVLVVVTGLSAHADLRDNELFRIRIENERQGLVQVSTDGGRSYLTVGRVTVPANARITGFPAASYTPAGTVAAVATHALRIKTGQHALDLGKAQMPLMFSITPLQFSTIPKGYGGHIPRSSAVYTDIHAGRSIFRNLAPYVGSPVYLERTNGLSRLPEDYMPLVGDTFVIIVTTPDPAATSIEFENIAGGAVTVNYADGRSDVIAEVVRPVTGVGRYDGTTFTGVGAVNTNHGGVITISTTPVCPPETVEGGPIETRGGFMIQPALHVEEQHERSPQVMVVKPAREDIQRLEGTPPLFYGHISLDNYESSPDASFKAQVRVDGGGWEDMPKVVGRVDNAFTAEYLNSHFARIGKARTIHSGVTHIRLLLPSRDRSRIARDLQTEAAEYTSRVLKNGVKPVKGALTIAPETTPPEGSVVSFFVDGRQIYTSNRYPFKYQWDTRTVADGLHTVAVRGPKRTSVNRVLVLNN